MRLGLHSKLQHTGSYAELVLTSTLRTPRNILSGRRPANLANWQSFPRADPPNLCKYYSSLPLQYHVAAAALYCPLLHIYLWAPTSAMYSPLLLHYRLVHGAVCFTGLWYPFVHLTALSIHRTVPSVHCAVLPVHHITPPIHCTGGLPLHCTIII